MGLSLFTFLDITCIMLTYVIVSSAVFPILMLPLFSMFYMCIFFFVFFDVCVCVCVCVSTHVFAFWPDDLKVYSLFNFSTACLYTDLFLCQEKKTFKCRERVIFSKG